MDFVAPVVRTRNGRLQIFPDFRVKRTKDLMIRGRAFYAIWDEERGMWSRDESDLVRLVDQSMAEFAEEQRKVGNICDVMWMSNYASGSWKDYQSYLHTMFDTYIPLDSKVTFLSQERKRNDYVSKRLPYDLEEGIPESYERLMSTLYSKEERRKLEWAIGGILNGEGKDIQKFIVLYGQSGAGKSTFLHIVEQLCQGYWTNFDAKSITSNQAFSTHFFKDNPLVAIQHDGDLSRIEDNSVLNSIIAHEEIVVNEKFKAQYTDKSLCFLFLGTNSPVKITDAKSGLIRRLIDVSPTGNLLSLSEYRAIMERIPFELGKIANKCIKVYRHFGRKYYDDYRPMQMMYLTDPFFNFVDENMDFFFENDPVSLTHAYDVYKDYCEKTNANYILQRYKFREELKNYFEEFESTGRIGDRSFKSVYRGFIKEKFEFDQFQQSESSRSSDQVQTWLYLDKTTSLLDTLYDQFKAQYSKADGTPFEKWENVTRTLKDIDTSKCHYVKPPENHIVIDFDLKVEGKKNAAKNIEAANKFPPTYAEYSQGGEGLHLHYIYDGDPSKLARNYDESTEIKVFTGGSSLRRRLSKCNDIPIAHIASGLPLKEDKKVINIDRVQDEKALRSFILKNLRKEIHPYTKPSIDFIFKKLEDAYRSGMSYDVRDMRSKIFSFAAHSTNQAQQCLKIVNKMHFCSEDYTFTDKEFGEDERIIFFDVEVFPNLLLVNWKFQGTDSCVRMINPSPHEVGELFKYKLIGFNNRRYDNHILYARYLGYNNEELYQLTKKIINKKQSDAFFKEAYNLSYTDVYDFAAKKQSLKKWEIEMGIHHMELGLPWDEPVPEELWPKVAEYCDNDVIATEKLFEHLKGDWIARQILADLAGSTPNDTTNQLTTKIIFGNERHPKLVYTDLATGERL